jgi:hypothetical protein
MPRDKDTEPICRSPGYAASKEQKMNPKKLWRSMLDLLEPDFYLNEIRPIPSEEYHWVISTQSEGLLNSKHSVKAIKGYAGIVGVCPT